MRLTVENSRNKFTAGDAADPRRLLEIAARMGRVRGYEYDVATGQFIWLRQTCNIFEEDESAPMDTGLANFMSPADFSHAIAQLNKTAETGQPTEDEFDAVTAKGNAIRIHVLREAEWENGRIAKIHGAIRDITQEARTRRELQRANETLKDAIGIAGVRLWEADADLEQFHYTSDPVAPGDGRPTQVTASVADTAFELVTATEWLAMKGTFERVLETGGPATARWRITRPGVGARWIEHRLRRRTDADGRAVLCGASRDVTDEVRTQEELECKTAEATAAVARLKALIGASAGLIYEMNADWTTMRHLSLTGHHVEAAPEPTDRWLETYVYPDDRQRVVQAIQAAIHWKRMFEIEHRVIRADGQIGWTHSRAIPILGPDGEIQSWFGMAYSSTERKRAETALRQSELRHRSLIAATSTVTWSSPPSGLHVSPQLLWMAFTGQAADEVLGSGWADAIHPDDREAIASEWERCVPTGQTFEGTVRVRRHDGEWRWMSVRAVPVRDEEGAIQEWFGMHIDITERKTLELELQNALVAANAANNAKSTFIANMSHEIRTPMSTVIGMLEVLLQSQLSADQRDHAATAVSSSRQLLHILNDVLDASAIEAGRMPIQARPFKVRDLLTEKLAMFGLLAEQKGLALTAMVAADVPQWQLADERRIRQVMNNLIGNALKYTDKGAVEIIASFDAGRDALRIEVIDSGIGISEEIQRNLFQPFAQADSTSSRRHEGSGLGLSISRKLVELMGGQIGLSSRFGEGSAFWFELPAPACQAAVDDASTDHDVVSVPPLRILVAEDNRAAQRIVEAVLTAMGHTVTIVDSGALAVAEAAGGRYDVVLMDVMMPGMDGPTATRKIRELGGRAGGIPIIALTADILFGKDGRHLMAGMTDYLSKPIDVVLLAEALKRASNHAHAESA